MILTLSRTIEFRDSVLAAGILDPEGVHHEFVSGLHGRKLDFDAIPTESQPFAKWVEAISESIVTLYPEGAIGKIAVMSVANGTNRVVPRVADQLGGRTTSILTTKISSDEIILNEQAREDLHSFNPDLVVAVEDAASTGKSTASAIRSLRATGLFRAVVLNTWQRRENLEELDAINQPYESIINEILPTYTPEECADFGYHAEGWLYIPHD